LLLLIAILFSASLLRHWPLWANGIWTFFYLICVCFFLIFMWNVVNKLICIILYVWGLLCWLLLLSFSGSFELLRRFSQCCCLWFCHSLN
jgi:hypothetical protein